MTIAATPVHVPYRVFPVRVARRTQLSPSFIRFTFTGDDVEHFGDDGPDQRIKVWIAPPGRRHPVVDPENWYQSFRALPDDVRGDIRTYTIRAVRPELAEVDVDFVLHGVSGPASAWATSAQVGDEVVIVGPNRQYGADCRGHEWKPPAQARTVIVAGDETAVPAVARILEAIARDGAAYAATRVLAFLEVPHAVDALDVASAPNAEVTWLARDSRGTAHGELLVDAVCAAAKGCMSVGTSATAADVPSSSVEYADIDIDVETLWEVADVGASGADLYAWIAGEAGAVKQIRRYLVSDLGVDRRHVTFQGYWRHGRAEG